MKVNPDRCQSLINKGCKKMHFKKIRRKLGSVLNSVEAVVRRCSVKKVFLKISQNSQENTCARGSFFKQLLKMQIIGPQILNSTNPPSWNKEIQILMSHIK